MAPHENGGLAAEVLLQHDPRPRDIYIEETLAHFTFGGSDATRLVMLAAAKSAYEELHPETAHGKRPKPKRKGAGAGKDAAPASFPPFAAYAEERIGGWKARTISTWCKIGAAISQAAYERLLGTSLANDIGALETFSALREDHQVEVAAMFVRKLDVEARDLLARLSREPSTPPTSIDATSPIDWSDIIDIGEGPPANDGTSGPPTVQGPPEGATEVEVPKLAGGENSYFILHGHVLAVADMGATIRVTYLAKVAAATKPESVNRESWIDAVGRAAMTINRDGRYVATVSQITWVPPTAKDPAHHRLEIRCEPTLPFGRRYSSGAVTITVRRWENAAATEGFGPGFAYDPYRSKVPVLTVGDSAYRRPIPYDWTELQPLGPTYRARMAARPDEGDVILSTSGPYGDWTIEQHILSELGPAVWTEWRRNSDGVSPEEYVLQGLSAKAARRPFAHFQWKSHEWFTSSDHRRPFVQRSTERDRRYARVLPGWTYQYKLRAEAWADLVKLANALLPREGSPLRIMLFTTLVTYVDGLPKFEMSLTSPLRLTELHKIIAQIADGHVMYQTVQPIHLYTGERDLERAAPG